MIYILYGKKYQQFWTFFALFLSKGRNFQMNVFVSSHFPLACSVSLEWWAVNVGTHSRRERTVCTVISNTRDFYRKCSLNRLCASAASSISHFHVVISVFIFLGKFYKIKTYNYDGERKKVFIRTEEAETKWKKKTTFMHVLNLNQNRPRWNRIYCLLFICPQNNCDLGEWDVLHCLA